MNAEIAIIMTELNEIKARIEKLEKTIDYKSAK